ncbi:serine hydrolase domain-containing protein [Spirosoma utsteinense]|uniref:serine hydrolase domain-containing protein n=1 Tax=Spirosoma utsteinense TaxID=2585773 RepID=UPI001644AC5A|nr:serine hydrolase domain-containing protein [Spirosoma utsteinense]MBC3789101.1 CubicO group peptidase (beta-lactamase class C family) [Spirosoma utsteinense]
MTRLIWLGTILLLLTSCHQTDNQQAETFRQTQQELTRKLTIVSKTVGVKGFGVALVNDQRVLYQNGFGVASSETNQRYHQNTIQNIASVSKTLIGIALLKAQELGKLKLDDPINKYLPFPVINPYYPATPITIRQLATHTSSINDTQYYLTKTIVLKDTINLSQNLKLDISPTKFNPPSAKIPIEEFLNNILNKKGKWYLKDGFLNHKPGAIFNYSNVGATLTALVIEKATGISYDQFTTTFILKPLKMTASGWHFNAIDLSNYTHTFQNKTTPYPYYSLNTYPDGGLLTSSRDMSKYILELMKGYFEHGSLLSKESYKEYFRPQLNEENFLDRSVGEYSDEYNMGITIGFGSTGNFGHTGGDPGVSSGIWFFKNKKMGRYLIVNTDWDPKTIGKDQIAIYSLLEEYFAKLDQLSHLK